MKRKVFIRLLIIAGGLGIILLSLFAFQLGLDNDPGWGPRRIQLIVFGLAVILFGSLYWLTPWLAKTFGWEFNPTSAQPSESSQIKKNDDILLIISGCLVLVLYLWIVTAGRITQWPSGRDYYWKLSQAFQNGQLYLLEEPNPELAKLENPYDHHQREGLAYLWDTTYYDGKYFLYWGPVPAVLGALISPLTSRPVTDAGLVFSFVMGTALFSVLLLREISRQYKIPRWAFWGGVSVSMVNVPLIWLLTRPTFYEVSISGGQFFMMAGFYLLFLGFRNPQLQSGWIAASALSFGLAGASRINLLPSVIVLAALILWRIYISNNKQVKASISSFAATLLPLSLIACSLFWYNHARFGSIFEFGHRYQLTGSSLTADYGDISSVTYILPNTFTYIFRLPALNSEFPFLTVPWIKEKMWPSFIHLPENYYYTEPVAGILFIIPLIGLAAFLLARLFWIFINGDAPRGTSLQVSNPSLLLWFGFSLAVYVFIQMSILLVFVNSAMRYLLDVSPALIVLSTIFVGYYVNAIDRNPHLVKIIRFLWVFAAVLTVLAGFLIGFTGDKNNFLNRNPQLYYQFVEWFSR